MTADEEALLAVAEPLAEVFQAGHPCSTCGFVGDLHRADSLLRSGWLADHDRQQHDQTLESIRPAIDVFAQLTEAWAHLRMDTDQDQRLHDRLVTLSRQAIRAARHADAGQTRTAPVAVAGSSSMPASPESQTPQKRRRP